MSIPPSLPIEKLVERLLKASRGLSPGDVAARWGVTRSYVTQLRTGYRPQRMGAERRAALVALVEALEGGYDERKADARGRAEFYDGVLFAAEAMSGTVTRLLQEAREGLRSGALPAPTPLAAEIADGLAGLRAEEEQREKRKSSKR